MVSLVYKLEDLLENLNQDLGENFSLRNIHNVPYSFLDQLMFDLTGNPIIRSKEVAVLLQKEKPKAKIKLETIYGEGGISSIEMNSSQLIIEVIDPIKTKGPTIPRGKTILRSDDDNLTSNSKNINYTRQDFKRKYFKWHPLKLFMNWPYQTFLTKDYRKQNLTRSYYPKGDFFVIEFR